MLMSMRHAWDARVSACLLIGAGTHASRGGWPMPLAWAERSLFLRVSQLLGYVQLEWDAELNNIAAAEGAPVPGAAVQSVTAGKDKGWAEMSATEQAAATMLQYSQSSWDAGESTAVTSKPWATLTANERSAAQARM